MRISVQRTSTHEKRVIAARYRAIGQHPPRINAVCGASDRLLIARISIGDDGTARYRLCLHRMLSKGSRLPAARCLGGDGWSIAIFFRGRPGAASHERPDVLTV